MLTRKQQIATKTKNDFTQKAKIAIGKQLKPKTKFNAAIKNYNIW